MGAEPSCPRETFYAQRFARAVWWHVERLCGRRTADDDDGPSLPEPLRTSCCPTAAAWYDRFVAAAATVAGAIPVVAGDWGSAETRRTKFYVRLGGALIALVDADVQDPRCPARMHAAVWEIYQGVDACEWMIFRSILRIMYPSLNSELLVEC